MKYNDAEYKASIDIARFTRDTHCDSANKYILCTRCVIAEALLTAHTKIEKLEQILDELDVEGK